MIECNQQLLASGRKGLDSRIVGLDTVLTLKAKQVDVVVGRRVLGWGVFNDKGELIHWVNFKSRAAAEVSAAELRQKTGREHFIRESKVDDPLDWSK